MVNCGINSSKATGSYSEREKGLHKRITTYLSFGLQYLKMQAASCEKLLCSTANQITPLPSVLLKHCVDWLGLFMARSEPLCLIPIYRARTVLCNHQRFF